MSRLAHAAASHGPRWLCAPVLPRALFLRLRALPMCCLRLGPALWRLSSDHVSLFGDSAPDPRASHGDQALTRRPGFAALLCALRLADLRQLGPDYGHAHGLWRGDFMADGLDAGSGLAARENRRFSCIRMKDVTFTSFDTTSLPVVS